MKGARPAIRRVLACFRDPVFLACLLLGAACMPYLLADSGHRVWTMARGVDEYEFIHNVDKLLQVTWGDHRQWGRLTAFAYGGVYWGLSALVAYPFWRLGLEQGMVVALRLFSLLPALLGFWLVGRILVGRGLRPWRAAAWVGLFASTSVNVASATFVHPETPYACFLVLAVYALHRDGGRLGRWGLFSLVAFALAVGVKTLALPFAVVYLLYGWVYRSRLGVRSIGLAALVGLAALGLCHVHLLYPEIRKEYLDQVAFQSTVVKHGWSGERPGLGLGRAQIQDFSMNYIWFPAWVALVAAGGWRTAGLLRARAPVGMDRVLSGMSWILVAGYGFFCLVVAYQPAHYGIAVVYFLPLALGLDGRRFSARAQAWAWLAVAAALALPLRQSFVRIRNPQGGPWEQERRAALRDIQGWMAARQDLPKRVGVSHDLGIPPFGRGEVSFHRLWNFTEKDLARYDLIVLWRRDTYAPLFLEEAPAGNPTAEAYRRLADGLPLGENQSRFVKADHFHDLEIYQRAAP